MNQKSTKLFLAFVCVGLFANNIFAQREITSVSDILQADPETAALFFDVFTGDFHVSIGENVLIFALEGAPYDLENINVDTKLGSPAQSDQQSIGWLNFMGLPTGVFNLGSLLPADPAIRSGADFDALYPDALFRVGVAGMPESNPPVVVITGVPEPGSVGVIGLLSCLLAAHRRR